MIALIVVGAIALAGWLIGASLRAAQLWRRATFAAKSGDWSGVERSLAARHWYQPADVEAIRLRVNAALQRNDLRGALASLGDVPAGSPERADALEMRGKLLFRLGDLASAEGSLRDALRLQPDRIEARRQLVAILGIERRGDEQEAELWPLLATRGHEVETLRLLAQAGPAIPPDAFERSDDEGTVLARAIAASPKALHLRPALAYFERNRGRIDAAHALLDAELRLSPNEPAALIERLACWRDEGDADSARPWFVEVPPILARDAPYHGLRGEWREARGDLTAATDSYRTAIALDPRPPEPRYRLALALRAIEVPLLGESDSLLAYCRDAATLRALVARIADQAPDRSLCAEAESLCARMGRDREARAWGLLARPGRGG